MNTIQDYHDSLDQIGLKKTWDIILNDIFPNDFFSEDRLGGLYEDGLAYSNKIEKKAMGKYYTPIDVAQIMSKYLLTLNGENICDLCTGTGNLILSVLETMGPEEAKRKIANGNIYLYDIDDIALNICLSILRNRYGDIVDNIHIINADCLDESVQFPENAKIISNPPYGKQNDLSNSNYICAKSTKELYVAFMEKIIASKNAAVIITPHSFLGGDSFKSLRKELNEEGGYIFAFDNVPGNIFNGKKFGIFNSNEANSTRAAITIINPQSKGYQIAQFIRFKAAERAQVLDIDFLNSLLPSTIQNNKDEIFYRIEKGTEDIVTNWIKSNIKLSSLISNTSTGYYLDIPNTCRYFTTGAKRTLKRSGKISLYFKDENSFYLAYAFINSSFCYYWHRMCNGGVTYPKTLLKNMPIFGQVTDELKQFCDKMISEEEQYIVRKKNAGQYQENIKFPMEYRQQLNNLLLSQLGIQNDSLLLVHSNSCLNKEINLEEEE